MLKRTDLREQRAKDQEFVDKASDAICSLVVCDLLLAAKLAENQEDTQPVLRRLNDTIAQYGVPIILHAVAGCETP